MVKREFFIAIACALPFDAGMWMTINSWHYYTYLIDYLTSRSAYIKQFPHPMGYVADFAIGIITMAMSLYFALYFLRKWGKRIENE